MTRLGHIKLEDMTEEQLEYLDIVMKRPVHRDMPRTDPLRGPYNAWLRSPNLFVNKMMPLVGYLRGEGVLNDRLAELAIITVGRVWSSEFEFAAHAPNAITAGISQDKTTSAGNKCLNIGGFQSPYMTKNIALNDWL